MQQRFVFLPLAVMMAALAGCGSTRAPSIYVAGSYFPAWLLCAVAGIVGAFLVRVAFVRLSLDDILPLRSLLYTCIAILIALIIGLGFFY
ncbi:MAG TPA: YtcA family lipoprotein [Pusillimonas sp.]|uniref:YtcA family lipoprotein n=1 Tax=unclassified Pusillimonas TaxID=2640016 RepID=UPI002639B3AA|nr:MULTISPECIES: YtcA family lipoprotein [unclassified Pusillimonas]HLU19075.1 YtcA family lipoprotein [Pusillimonas sp.]